jgi:hypothetical protein
MSASPATTVLSLGQLLEQQSSAPPPCLIEPGLLPAQGIRLWAGNRKLANRCWSPIWRCRSQPDATGWGFRFPLGAACWCASSNCRSRSLSVAWPLCGVRWVRPPTRTFSSTLAPPVIYSARPRGCNTSWPRRRLSPPESSCWIRCIPPTIRTKTTPARWLRCVRVCCGCGRRPAPRSSWSTTSESRSAVTRLAAPSAARAHAVGDSYVLLTRPSPQFDTVELRFQFRYAAPQPPRLLQLDSTTLWFSAAGARAAPPVAERRKVEPTDVRQALTELGSQARYNQLRQQIMTLTECSKRTAQMAIATACQQGLIVQTDGHYGLTE